MPPKASDFSTRCTGYPCRARDKAAVRPATPPPTTSAERLTGRFRLLQRAGKKGLGHGHAHQILGFFRGRIRIIGVNP